MAKKRKRKLKKKVLILLIFLIIACGIMGFTIKYFEKERKQAIIDGRNKRISEIKKHYGEVVKVVEDADIFVQSKNSHLSAGRVSKDTLLKLDKVNINYKTQVFKISNTDYYIEFQKVTPSDEKITIDDRYKNYLLFNENVKTKKPTKLYKGDKLVFSLDKEVDLPIVKKDTNGYYVEYFNELFFIKKDNVSSTYQKNNTNEVESSAIPVTCNHFIYLEGDKTCNEIICHSEKQIREEFNYLRENKYFTLTTTELREWIEGKIRLPEKSILITIDDGARAWNFIPLLEEYKLNATLFLITGWYDLDRFQSPYLELASHTHDLHVGGKCPGGQGSGLKCLDKKFLLADLKKSRDKLHGSEAFCYPFYEFNDYSTQVIKEAGFKMAFIGGMQKATKNTDLYHIPRISFNSSTTLNEYINYIK